MTAEIFLEKFALFADAPNAVAQMRQLVRALAVRGKLFGEPVGDEVASTWNERLLGDVAQFINGDRSKNYPSKSFRVDAGVPFINAGHLSNGDVDLSYMDYISVEHFDRLGGGKVQRGDVLYCLRGSLGKCAVVQSIDFGAIASSLLIIRPSAEVIPRFVYLFLTSPLGSMMISKYDNGSAQPNLSAANVKKYVIFLPPLAEQKRIVAKVDELMALCDRLEAQQKEREAKHALLARAALARFAEAPTPANLEYLFHSAYTIDPADLRKSILAMAARGKLVHQDAKDIPASELLATLAEKRPALAKAQHLRVPKPVAEVTADDAPHELPDSWEWCRIGQLALVVDYGTSQKADTNAANVPVYRMGNIVGGKVINASLKYVSAKIDDLPGLYLKNEDILFNRTNSFDLVGKSGLYKGKDDVATFASYLIRIRVPSAYVLPEFITIAMNAPYYRTTQIEPEVVQQCGQANFNGSKLSATVVPVPPLAEQRRIVAKVDALMALVDRLEAQLAESRALAGRLMEAIVAELSRPKSSILFQLRGATHMSDDTNTVFKRGGEDLRVLVVHSTKEALGEETAKALVQKLGSGVTVVANERVRNLDELLKVLGEHTGAFDVLVLLSHGAKASNATYLFEDFDKDGNSLGLRAGHLALLKGMLDDTLCLFGVCHFGSDELADAIVKYANALVCIAPKPGETISKTEIVEGYGEMLIYMGQQRGVDFGLRDLNLLLERLKKGSTTLHAKISVGK